jgi:hypothetical protein
MAGLWQANATPFCKHIYYGCSVSTGVVDDDGPTYYHLGRNQSLGTGSPVTDIITVMFQYYGNRLIVRPDGKPIQSRAVLQLSVVPPEMIDGNALADDEFGPMQTALQGLFPFSIVSGGNTYNLVILSQIAGLADEVVTPTNRSVPGLFGSRIDRVLNRSNNKARRPAIPAPPALQMSESE